MLRSLQLLHQSMPRCCLLLVMNTLPSSFFVYTLPINSGNAGSDSHKFLSRIKITDDFLKYDQTDRVKKCLFIYDERLKK